MHRKSIGHIILVQFYFIYLIRKRCKELSSKLSPTVKNIFFNGIYSNKIHVSFLTDMDDRAAERVRLKAERDEKRKQAEEERLVTNSNEKTKNNYI